MHVCVCVCLYMHACVLLIALTSLICRFQFLDFDECPEEEESNQLAPPSSVPDSSSSHTPSPSLRVHHTMNTTNPSPLIKSRQTSDKSPQGGSRQKRSSLPEALVNGVQDSGKLNLFQRLSHKRNGSNASGSEGSSASLHSEGDNGVASSFKNGRDIVNLTDYKTKRPASFAV